MVAPGRTLRGRDNILKRQLVHVGAFNLSLILRQLLVAAFSIGIGVPYHYFGGIKPMFQALVQAKVQHLTMPGSTATMGHTWYISTVLLTSMGFYMWPHAFCSVFTAKKWQYAAAQRRYYAALHHYASATILRRLYGYSRHAGTQERRPGTALNGPEDVLALVPGPGGRSRCADQDGACRHPDPRCGHIVRKELLPSSLRSVDERCGRS